MKSIKVSIFGKQYPLRVEESEEQNMVRIAQFVDEKFKQYKKELSKQPESTVMVLAALSIAEELFEQRHRNEELENRDEEMMQDINQSVETLLKQIQ